MQNSRNYYEEFMQVYKEGGLASAMIYDLERTLERNLGVNIADSIIACTVEGSHFVWSMIALPYTFHISSKNIREREIKSEE